MYGSGSFYHQTKIVRKTLIPTVLWLLYDFLSFKNDVNVASKSNKQKNLKKKSFLLASWRSMTKECSFAGSGSISQKRGSGSVPKCHGSATLRKTVSVGCFFFSWKPDQEPDLISSVFVACKKPTLWPEKCAFWIYKFMKPVEPVLVVSVLDPDSDGSVDPDPD